MQRMSLFTECRHTAIVNEDMKRANKNIPHSELSQHQLGYKSAQYKLLYQSEVRRNVVSVLLSRLDKNITCYTFVKRQFDYLGNT